MRSFPEAFKVGSSFIYGRTDDMNRIIKLLSLEDGSDLNSTVISIVADRGTGRTILLHLLRTELCSAFDTSKFICMPEKFDEKGLIRLIIESLTGIPCDITDLEVLKETVKEELMDQRLLLLLDNFENKSQKCWDLLWALLNDCKEKSAVVVTATREAVAMVKGPMQFYYMNNLSKEWCWMIFKQGVFFGQNSDADTELTDIGKRLVARCRNVTLCIKVLSGVLRYSISADGWRAVLDNKFWEMDEADGDVPPALRVCYEFLPSHLKYCFKYCSLFPKEYIFSKQHLVRLWLSQGFIEPGEGRELEDIGTEYFDQLLSLSFFQPSLIPGKEEDKFVMPGLIHDLAQQFSKNECFQFEGCVQSAPENARHLSLVPHEFQSISLSQLITRAQNLQTVLVVSRSAFQHQNISSSMLTLLGLEDISVKFHGLITLNLNNSDIEELPESFGTLINLRYLGLSSTKIKRIPLEISNLIHLQTLEAKDCLYLEELPTTIEQLTNLRYLDVTKEAGYVVMPRGIGKLTNLRSLATFNVGSEVQHCGIEELKNLVFLRGCLEIAGLVNVGSGFSAMEVDMRSIQHIETLSLLWSDSQVYLDRDEGVETAEEVLWSLYPTYNIKELVIRDYPGNYFPKWIEWSSFSMLVSLILDHCYNCEMLPYLGGLPSLKFLSIQRMHSVKRIELSNSKNFPVDTIRYPSLEMLNIWEMYQLEHWDELGDQNFPQLRSLTINKCAALRSIPQFSSLVELSIHYCTRLPEGMGLPSLKSLKIEGLQKTSLINLPESLVGLKILHISHCPELVSVEGLLDLTLIEMIKVIGCPKLDFGSNKYLYRQKEGNYTRFGASKELDSKKQQQMVTESKSKKPCRSIDDAVPIHPSERAKQSGSLAQWLDQTEEEETSACSLDSVSDGNLTKCLSINKHDTQGMPRKRKDTKDSLVSVLAKGHERITELGPHLNEEEQSLVEIVQRTLRDAIDVAKSIDSNSESMQHWDPPSPSSDIFRSLGSCSGTGERLNHHQETSKRRKTLTAQMRRVLTTHLEDGYSWKQHRQNHVYGSSQPSYYYYCINKQSQRCKAKRHVQQNEDDPSIFEITHWGEHTCVDLARSVSVTPQEQTIQQDQSSSIDPWQRQEIPTISPSSSSSFNSKANDLTVVPYITTPQLSGTTDFEDSSD